MKIVAQILLSWSILSIIYPLILSSMSIVVKNEYPWRSYFCTLEEDLTIINVLSLQLLQLHVSIPTPWCNKPPGYPAIIGVSSGVYSCVEKDLGYHRYEQNERLESQELMVWVWVDGFSLSKGRNFAGSNDVRGCITNWIFSFMLVGFSRWIHFMKQKIMSCWILGIHVEWKQTSVSIIVVLYLTWPGNIPANQWWNGT